MHTSLDVKLRCCEAIGTVADVNADAVARGRLEQCRRNLVCPSCQRLVILTLTHHAGGLSVVDQEVIDLGPMDTT